MALEWRPQTRCENNPLGAPTSDVIFQTTVLKIRAFHQNAGSNSRFNSNKMAINCIRNNCLMLLAGATGDRDGFLICFCDFSNILHAFVGQARAC